MGGGGPDLSAIRDFGQILSATRAKSAISSDFEQILSAISAKSVQKGPKGTVKKQTHVKRGKTHTQ